MPIILTPGKALPNGLIPGKAMTIGLLPGKHSLRSGQIYSRGEIPIKTSALLTCEQGRFHDCIPACFYPEISLIIWKKLTASVRKGCAA